MSDYGLDDLNGDNNIDLPDLPDLPDFNFHLPELPDFSKFKLPDVSSMAEYWWVIPVILAVAYIIYKNKRHLPSIPSLPGFSGGKYAPKGSLSDDMRPHGRVGVLDWKGDNGVATVCQKTGDLYMAAGDTTYAGRKSETIIFKCSRGKDPRDKNNWSLWQRHGGKCYGLTVLPNGDVVGIKSDSGSMWRGATSWRICNFTNGKKSGIIDKWWYQGTHGAGTGQFSFVEGEGSKRTILMLRARKAKFWEYGGTTKYVTIDAKKLKSPDKLKKSDFSNEEYADGLVSRRVSSGWPMSVQVSVIKDGKGKYHGIMGEFVTSHLFYYVSHAIRGFRHVRTHNGDGVVPKGGRSHFYGGPNENFTYGVFTGYVVFFNGEYWIFMSGSDKLDNIYVSKIS